MFFTRRRPPSLSGSSDATSSPSSPYIDDDEDTSSYSLSSVDEVDQSTRLHERRRRAQVQQEWDEGMEQLQLIFVVVLMPWLGKYWGRKWAHTLHARYLRIGLGKAFFYFQLPGSTFTVEGPFECVAFAQKHAPLLIETISTRESFLVEGIATVGLV